MTGIIGVAVMKFVGRYAAPKADLSNLPLFTKSMEELAEAIIPETDTPGAKSAGVSVAVFLLVEHCLSEREQAVFLKGLEDLDKHCKAKFGRTFAVCAEKERLNTLIELESDANFGGWFIRKVKQRLFGKPFIILAKELTALCYCRSMQGATLALVYDPVPARYDGCIEMEKNQRSWALT
ncbi:gluconate 2-dehydrogenase subunit 3 family protein [Parapedobacter sp. 10938]|uniref:gluconate 2-dehydrogenase subunit 3 family protein n=1 Tax=Parapedobacter flavus TaxID=3110225 RepID=UPI002DBDA3F1|nr:gluconate 2-dehydrogenase subunit 3 family protein [Parapedobacter sp. 10938]MEC3879895.1 gluconate 2-dehydrogenase subunit 3 family protein [Parapedobacter sp. 10938]